MHITIISYTVYYSEIQTYQDHLIFQQYQITVGIKCNELSVATQNNACHSLMHLFMSFIECFYQLGTQSDCKSAGLIVVVLPLEKVSANSAF